MLYLIGGPPRCGKTTVARHLARITGASLLGLDNIERAVYHYLSSEERATTMPHFAEETNNERYAAHTVPEIIAMLQACARALWPAIHILMHQAVESDRDVILDGYHFEPRVLAELTPPGSRPGEDGRSLTPYQAAMVARGSGHALPHAGDPRIRAVFLCREDPADIVASLTKTDDPNDWIVCQPNTPETLQRIAAMISGYSHYIRQEAEAYGGVVFSMDHAFHSQVERVLACLTDHT